jgi:hypothetical protein
MRATDRVVCDLPDPVRTAQTATQGISGFSIVERGPSKT